MQTAIAQERTLETLRFDNTFARLPAAFYRRVKPTPLPSVHLVSFNPAAAELIGLDPEQAKRPEFADYFAGNKLLPGSEPVAAIYAGHQFGSFVPQLGDGRAILLGEAVNEMGGRFDVQLKGAGMTPFSRMGDGRAVLRSSIREYLCSEAMHALGVPTSRALCVIGSPEPVYREERETAAVVTRLAESFVRFGSFELFYYREQFDRVRELADYVIREHYARLAESENKYLELLREVVRRTARLIAKWQAVGFAHGVMNTDNMSILGLTIDYGPFGFLDEFDAGFICNHSDYAGRYAFDQQPAVGLWNLSCFAQTLVPELVTREQAVEVLNEYQIVFADAYAAEMRRKLGLEIEQEADGELVFNLLEIMQRNQIDYARFFRRLCDFDAAPEAKNDALRDMFIDPAAFDGWAGEYRARLSAEASSDVERRERMRGVNPKYVLRNHTAQMAIEAAERGDFTETDLLLKVLQAPFDEHTELERFAEPLPVGSQKIVVSCSS